MGTESVEEAAPGLTLDTGALIALERGDRKMLALLQASLSAGLRFRVPAGVVGQVWRDGRRQAVLARFLRAKEVNVKVLDEPQAKACGQLCGATGVSDVVDASVVVVARASRDIVVTSDPDDARLDPRLNLVAI